MTAEERAERRKQFLRLKEECHTALVASIRAYADDLDQHPSGHEEAQRARHHADVIAQRGWMAPLMLPEPPAWADAKVHAARKTYTAVVNDVRDRYQKGLIPLIEKSIEGEACAELMTKLHENRDSESIGRCMDFYWHHQGLDWPPLSHSYIIRLSRRYLVLNPHDVTTWCDTAWLMWSRWVTWKNNPVRKPAGMGGDEQAIELLREGRTENPQNAHYHLEAAKTVWGLAKYHKKKYFQFMIESLDLANEHAESDAMRIGAARMLGHVHREVGDAQQAAYWYGKWLELAPDDDVAQRLVRDTQPKKTNPPPSPN